MQTTVSQAHQNSETTIPADLLLVRGACIDDDAMLSGESTLLLKDSIEPQEADARPDLTERSKPLCYLAVPRSCNQARESLRVRPMVVALRSFFAPVSALRKASSFAQCFSAQRESVPTTSSLSSSSDPFSFSLSPQAGMYG